jgi:hypothetical protein
MRLFDYSKVDGFYDSLAKQAGVHGLTVKRYVSPNDKRIYVLSGSDEILTMRVANNGQWAVQYSGNYCKRLHPYCVAVCNMIDNENSFYYA